MNRLINRLSKEYGVLSIEFKIYVVISLIGIIYSIIGGMMNIVFKIGILPVAISFFMTGVILSLLMYSLRSGRYEWSAFAAISILAVGFYPFIWITSGGSHGNAPYFYIFNFIIIAIIFRGAKAFILSAINILTLLSGIAIEYTHPEMIASLESDQVRLMDNGIFLIVICVCSFLLVHYIMTEYNLKIGKLDRNKEQLSMLSRTDTLSGLYNRRYIMEILKEKIDSQKSIALIMIDIDHFKSINDTYGHSIGDQVIVRIAETLKNSTRESDVLGRIGGEEFLIILDTENYDKTYFVAQKLRAVVSQLSWIKFPHQITISLGVYVTQLQDSYSDALEKVDICLYKAKELGRNKVVDYQDIESLEQVQSAVVN